MVFNHITKTINKEKKKFNNQNFFLIDLTI